MTENHPTLVKLILKIAVLLVLSVFLATAQFLIPLHPAQSSISWEDAYKQYNASKLIIIDARDKATSELYSLKGAVSLPYNASLQDKSAFSISFKTNALAVFCSSDDCDSASSLAKELNELGCQKVKIISGGYMSLLKDKSTKPSIKQK